MLEVQWNVSDICLSRHHLERLLVVRQSTWSDMSECTMLLHVQVPQTVKELQAILNMGNRLRFLQCGRLSKSVKVSTSNDRLCGIDPARDSEDP